MGDLAVVDVLAVQERKGSARGANGIDEKQFLAYCQDIQDQPQWRKQADKADDYYDGNQIDPETMQALKDAGMAELISNLIKPTIDVVLGMEAKTRTDWRVVADSDTVQDVAEALSEKIHEAERETRADRACSDAYAAEVKAGIGWVEVSRNSDPFKYPFRAANPHRREMDWDWRDRSPDLQEGRYLLRRRWFDLDEAQTYFPKHKELLEGAGTGWGAWWMNRLTESAELMHAFEQERGWTLEEWEYRDTIRRRICLYEMWYRQLRRGYVLKLPDRRTVEMNLDNPLHAMAVASGRVKPQPAIYSKWGMAIFAGPHKMHDFGAVKKRHPYIPFWGYRESLTGTPYGLIRSMISPQDEVNARRRKLMWLLSAVRLLIDSDALDDRYNNFQDVINELARPDAAIILNPDRANKQGGVQVDNNLHLSDAQHKIMVPSEEMIQKVAGVFNALLGRDSAANSGIAIDSLVEQGSTVLAEINDNYRFARRLVGESLMDLIKEDIGRDEVEVLVGEPGRPRKVIVLNQPVMDEQLGIQTLKNAVQQAGVRVALDDVPSTPSYRRQQFMMLAEMVKGMSPEAQAVLTPYLMESSDHPKRQKIADEFRQVMNLPIEGQENPQVQMLTQQVQQLTAALEQSQAALQSKEAFENKKLDIETRKVALQEREAEARADATAGLNEAKAREADARVEQIRSDTDRKDAEFALGQAAQQLGGAEAAPPPAPRPQAPAPAPAPQAPAPQAEMPAAPAAAPAPAADPQQLLGALAELRAAIERTQAEAGSQVEKVRDGLASEIADMISAEMERQRRIEDQTARAVAHASDELARRQEDMMRVLRAELSAPGPIAVGGARRGFKGAAFQRDAKGNVVGGVADYGGEKRKFKVVRGQGDMLVRIEFEAN